MEFDWHGMTEEDFYDYCSRMENGEFDQDEDSVSYEEGEYIGCVRVGDLCFDLLVEYSFGGFPILCYDLFVGGVDTGYGYSNRDKGLADLREEDDYPYDHVDGGAFRDTCISMTYEDFVSYAESVFRNFIEKADETYGEACLTDKANEPLHVW